MGATVSRALKSALQKWAYETTKHISAETTLKEAVKAAGTVSKNNFNTVVAQVCQKNGVAVPAANVIADYQRAVIDLATCINAFTKPERNQLKTVWGKLASGRTVTSAEQDACAVPIGRGRQLGTTNRQTIADDFEKNIFNPLVALVSSLGLSATVSQAVGLLFRHGELVYPASAAVWIDMILA